MKRIITLMITLALLLVLPAHAAEESVSPWARDAVDFAVAHGMMSASEQRPRDAATRAELAHMVSALLSLEAEADLSACKDIEAGAWYTADMAKAVAAGLYESAENLAPERELTREEAFQLLARFFGVPKGSLSTLARFQDSDTLNEWAAAPIAGMVEASYVQGGDGKLNAQGSIMRQDLANLLYRLSGSVLEEGGAVQTRGNVVVPAGVSVPEGAKIDGDLILCATQDGLTLTNVAVTGRIILHGGSLRLFGTSAKALIARGQDLRISCDTLPELQAAAGDLTLEEGVCESLTVGDASVELCQDAEIWNVALSRAGSRLTGAGQVHDVVLQDPGAISSFPARQDFSNALQDVRIVVAEALNEPTPEAPNVRTTVRFENTGSAAGQTYILAWYMDGKLMRRDWTFALSEGAASSFEAPASYEGKQSTHVNLLVRLSDGRNSVKLTQSVDRRLDLLVPPEPPVDTMHIEATVTYNVSLYETSSLQTWLADIPAGTVVTYSDYRYGHTTYVTLPDGRTGWVNGTCLQPSWKEFVQAEDFSVSQKERFVNETRGYSSDTDLLVWISRLTQRVNVFQGSKGNWKLIHTFLCATGKNTTPTTSGVFKYYSRTGVWTYSNGFYVRHPMLFNGGHAFHTLPYVTGTYNTLYDPTIGHPKSSGCIRMYEPDVDWLWNNMRIGTTVVAY